MASDDGYIPHRGLSALLNYKYKGGEYSWLDNKLNPFWAKCAELLPDTMAPNVVTLIGLGHLFAIGILALIYDPRLQGESPSWVYFINAYCLFMYQTFDAMDGKQARRTQSSSPLGQLFDHGCDSLGTNFIGLGLCSLMGYGPTISTIISLGTLQIPFFLCQWEENHVHVLRAQVANFGVTEGQYLSIALNLVTAIFGSAFWKLSINELLAHLVDARVPVGVLDVLEVRTVALAIAAVFPIILAVTSIINVAKSPGNFSRALILTLPLWLAQAYQISIYALSPAKELFHAYPIPFVIILGMLHSHLSNRIIVASVCHIESPLFHSILFPIPIIIALLYHADTTEESHPDLDTAIEAALLAHAVAICVQFAHFIIWVTNAICKLLKIRCFSIVKAQ
ncbi:Choline/ethanolaminephosphotransferase 1 [Hondaea fermentalgiana]|uniref:Choline/ethanolaminephosphotransferase 1 n=1 Tax=Hondaea fermentalgiana TaxID=2315210 RepID=A0A2R5GRS6_9STRA|nr:Choline/ethanolaminephosphotransferase 1 [Hondaea fermentalgiana]|eukprot:GBG31343.1 Choline/ethanolaminephosphotransferase 1 [Hondaea fermentalgiana]